MIENNWPPPGSAEERQAFAELQARLAPMFQRLYPDRLAPRTVLIVPSLSLDISELAKISGVTHYEERMLCMLMLLRLPHTHIIYVTSQAIDPVIIDYYLHLLPGIPSAHARRRLTLLNCQDASLLPLTQKVLERPRLLQRIQSVISDPETAHMACFSPSPLERTLAVHLDIPLYACDPALSHLGSKSGSREVFRQAGVAMPDGFECLRDEHDVSEALVVLKQRHPELRRAVVKLNEGFSGEGNAVFSYDDWEPEIALAPWVSRMLSQRLCFEAVQENWEHYRAKLSSMGGIVECFIEGDTVRSPSVQCRIDPLGNVELISTHEQILGGPSGQIFLGCAFPAYEDYRQSLQQAGLKVAWALRERKVLGRFSVDFIAVRQDQRWRLYALENNLRKGGTTHTYMMLQYLTDGSYNGVVGEYLTPTGQVRYYYATDNLQNPSYRGLTPEDLVDIAVDQQLHFHGTSQQGVMFHLIGALSEFGKLGMVCVADSRANARRFYDNTITVLDRESARLKLD